MIYFIVALICIFLVIGDAERLLCTCWLFVYLFWKNVYSEPLSILKAGLFVGFCLFLLIFDIEVYEFFIIYIILYSNALSVYGLQVFSPIW